MRAVKSPPDKDNYILKKIHFILYIEMLQNIANTTAAKDQAPCYVFSYFPSYFLRHASIPSLCLPPLLLHAQI